MNLQAVSDDPTQFLAPTWYIDSQHPAVREYAERHVAGVSGEIERAIRLFYAVRDDIRYSAYGLKFQREHFQGSTVLAEGLGWCVTKAVLLAACSRAVGIPCRLGYANVRNHLATAKLLERLQTDVFYYHGYNEFWLDGRWVKATVAFNKSLCEKARLLPLDFDGHTDSLYHPFDLEGRRHMEYLHDYGPHADVPYEAMLIKFAECYPMMMWNGDPAEAQALIRSFLQNQSTDVGPSLEGDFEAEIEAEVAAREQVDKD